MTKFSLLASLEAKPGKEADLERFLIDSFPQSDSNSTTSNFFALRTGQNTYGVFNTFSDESISNSMDLEVAMALFAKASEYLLRAPVIEKNN